MAEIDDVIPDVQVWRDGGPAAQVFDKLRVLRAVGERVREAAFDAAQAYDNVLARLDVLRRLARVLVGERADKLFGELLLDPLGHLVDEPDERAGLAAFAFHDGLAVGALAGIPPVVLRDGVDEVFGAVAHTVFDALGDDVEHVGVGEAQLRVVPHAFTVDEAVVLGTLLEEFLRRHEREEGVHRPVGLHAARLLAVGHGAVNLVPRGPDGVEGLLVEVIAHADARRVLVVQAAEREGLAPGRHRHAGRVPAHAEFTFEEGQRGVHGAAFARAFKEDVRAVVAVGEGLVGKVVAGLHEAERRGVAGIGGDGQCWRARFRQPVL